MLGETFTKDLGDELAINWEYTVIIMNRIASNALR